MFRSVHSGPSVEVFTPGGKHNGKESISYWKLTGLNKDKDKIFDNAVKSFVIRLEGNNATTKMESKAALLLVQRFLVLQLWIPVGKDFCIDLGLQDMQKGKRRITLSTTTKDKNKTPLHAKYPLGFVKRSEWMNLCVDLVSLVGDTWQGQTFQSLDAICISGNCRLRRIFTMKAQLPDTTNDDELYGFGGMNDDTELDSLPRMYMVGKDNLHLTQVINMKKLYYYERYTSGAVVTNGPPESDVEASGDGRRKQSSHVAFGSKVSNQQVPSNRENTAHVNHQKSARREATGPKGHLNRQGSAENLTHRALSAREGATQKGLPGKEGTEHRGPSSMEGSAQKRPSSREDSAQKGPSSREGSAQKGPSSREGSAQKGPSSREGSAQKGPQSRENSGKKLSVIQDDLKRTAAKESSRRVTSGEGERSVNTRRVRSGESDHALKAGSSREGSAQRGGSSREGSAHRRGPSRDGSTQRGSSSREGSGHTRAPVAKDQVTSHRKPHHSRSKSDTDYATARKFHSARGKSQRPAELKEGSVELGRDRTDSDPGTSKGDPEVTVDKESLRSSHTWTDGADGGGGRIPYVRPHPPAGPVPPSLGKPRRTHRVRSAGKERTPHAGHVQYIENAGNEQEVNAMAPPSVVANDDEVGDIMRAMQESYNRSVNKKYDSTTSDENSCGREERDEIAFVLEAMRHQSRSDASDTTTGGHEYEESDEDEMPRSNKRKDTVYTFSSKPNVLDHQKNSIQSHKHRTRSRDRASDRNYSNNSEQHGRRRTSRNKAGQSKSEEEDSINVNSLGDVMVTHIQDSRNSDLSRRRGRVGDAVSAASSEEEPQISRSRARKPRSPRHRPHKIPAGAASSKSRADPRHNDHRTQNGPSIRYAESDVTNVRVNGAPQAATPSGIDFRLHPPEWGAEAGTEDTLSIQAPLSISRKSLREIPGPVDDLRRSGGSKPYDPSNYQMAELSDSAELRILRNFQREEASTSSASENESDHTQKNTVEFVEDMRYRRDSDSGEEMTTLSTLTRSLNRQPHSYQDEMELGKSMGTEFFNASNPRAWAKVLSPVLPNSGTVANSQGYSNGYGGEVRCGARPENGYGDPQRGGAHTDEEEELDLLYDPVLNCYYDVKTNKYYELV